MPTLYTHTMYPHYIFNVLHSIHPQCVSTVYFHSIYPHYVTRLFTGCYSRLSTVHVLCCPQYIPTVYVIHTIYQCCPHYMSTAYEPTLYTLMLPLNTMCCGDMPWVTKYIVWTTCLPHYIIMLPTLYMSSTPYDMVWTTFNLFSTLYHPPYIMSSTLYTHTLYTSIWCGHIVWRTNLYSVENQKNYMVWAHLSFTDAHTQGV